MKQKNMKSQRAKEGGEDKYYTKQYIADYVTNYTFDFLDIKDSKIIEPAAGSGIFYNSFLKVTNKNNIKLYDINPEHPKIKKMDFFNLYDIKDTDIIITNPPFGYMSSLAIKFFNHAASFNVKYICFIIPKTFRKASIQNKLNINYVLKKDLELPLNSFTLYGESYDVPCCYQIWEYKPNTRTIIKPETCEWVQVVDKKNSPDICIRRTGGRAGQVLDGLEHTESSSLFFKIKKDYDLVIKAFNLMNIEKYINNTAGVRSISKNEIFLEINRIMLILTKTTETLKKPITEIDNESKNIEFNDF